MFGLFKKAAATETRPSGRTEKVAVRATISMTGGRKIACTTIELSDATARLSVSASTVLPEVFEVSIPDRSLRRRARLASRSGNVIGVRFV